MTPGAMKDMMGMSDADWTQMLDGFEGNGWDAGLQQVAGAQVYAHPPSTTTTQPPLLRRVRNTLEAVT